MIKDLQGKICEGKRIIDKNTRLDLYTDHLQELLGKALNTGDPNEIYKAVINAYAAGIAVGANYGKRKGATI